MTSPIFFAHPQCPPNLHKLDGYFCENEQVSLPCGTQPGAQPHPVGSSIGAGSCSAWGACTGESRTPLQIWPCEPSQCLGSSMPVQQCAHLQPWSLCHAISLCTQSWSPYPAGFPMCVHQQRWPLCHISLPCACVPAGMVPMRCKPSVCMGPCAVQAIPVLMQLGPCFRGCVPQARAPGVATLHCPSPSLGAHPRVLVMP